MARKQAALRFDGFVDAVRPDPAMAEPLVLLAGYVGRGAEPGTVRIHPDASLNHWYEIAEGDIVHGAPIGDSPLGGSNVWLKASARIGYGVAAPPPAPPEDGAAAPDTTAPAVEAPRPLGAAPPPTQSLMACMPMQPPGGPPTQSLMACMPMQPQGTLPAGATMFCQPAMGLTIGGCSPPQLPSPPAWSVFCPPPPPAPPITSAGCPALPPVPSWTLMAGCPNPFQPGGSTLAGCQGVSVVFMCPPR